MSEGLLAAVAALGCLSAAASTAIAVLAVRRARRTTSAPAPDPFHDPDADVLRGDPRTLKPGDLVEINGRTYAVRGSLRFTEGSWTWSEHLLDNPEGQRVWLSVEQNPDLELVLWTQVPSATVRPDEPTVDFDGRRYTRQESGRARFTGTGATGLDPSGAVEYHDYTAPDGPLLAFERFGDSDRWEVGRGERLHRAQVRIFQQAG